MIHKLFFNKNSHLIFDLFLNKTISSLYNGKVSNALTQRNYTTKNLIDSDFKSIYITKDIPNYFTFTPKDANTKFKEVLQYNGYLLNLSGYTNATDFINSTLNKRNRKNLNSKTNRLHENHNISSQVFFGSIDKQEYDRIFEDFYKLLNARFKKKKMYNRYLPNWNDLQASTFQKIQDRNASLHVIYDNSNPIAITLNFHLNDIVFSHIQTYDMNYSKYNMGDISMVHHIEWLINNHISIFDLSMGKTYYKEKWSNHTYHFFYHIFYNKRSIISRLSARVIALELKLLQFLRNKNIIGKLFMFDKLIYTYKSKVVKQ
ncbi:GNAT family N-acetyltransferase [Flavivirga eckloniae]|uniref:BioF2-like acetyltransferase domain-containing protein n=1 Tax=Flavivirga eckloniae TaxID=1803846 RepID=A0A2K9PJQ7_9FLAO|nr:GNAT family N-acetyltransferase [Flavivirga eckloniae]AUP77255.1 hypothetical protein C1H87_00390 [Flavivirga eckloniae]